jgi:hypothetical protein
VENLLPVRFARCFLERQLQRGDLSRQGGGASGQHCACGGGQPQEICHRPAASTFNDGKRFGRAFQIARREKEMADVEIIHDGNQRTLRAGARNVREHSIRNIGCFLECIVSLTILLAGSLDFGVGRQIARQSVAITGIPRCLNPASQSLFRAIQLSTVAIDIRQLQRSLRDQAACVDFVS